MTLTVRQLANGINKFQHILTPSRCFINYSECASRSIHSHSCALYPTNSDSLNASSAPFNEKRKTILKQPSKFSHDAAPASRTKSYVPPDIVLFHNPGSLNSVRIKKIFEEAQIAFPKTSTKIGGPLALNLVVHERLPSAHEIHECFLYIEDQNWSKFLVLDSSSFRNHPTNAAGVLEITQRYREQRLSEAQEGKMETDLVADVDDDPSDPSLDAKPEILSTTHPLFGTECFAWPIIFWKPDFAQIRPGWRIIYKRLHKYARLRDGVLSPQERELVKEEAKEKARRARSLEIRDVSPEEGDTLRWFNESSQSSQPRMKNWGYRPR